MLQRAQIERTGPLFELAQQRAAQQYAIGGIGGLLGIPAMAFPPGEQHQRELRQQFLDEVMPALDRGDTDAYRAFVDQHPEIEAWFGINKTPQEMMQTFLVDNVWSAYNQLPDYNQQEARDQFGPMFQTYFLDRETRDYSAIPPEILAGWSRALGEDVPNLAGLTPNPTVLQLTPPEIANRIQQFYDIRRQTFDWPAVRALQTEYFALAQDQRDHFVAAHQDLQRYWDWRRDFLYRNPDMIAYLVEDPSTFHFPTPETYEAGMAGQPNLTGAEWLQVLGPETWALIQDYQAGEPMPEVARRRIEEIASQMGTTYEHVLESIAGGLAQPQ
jgi:hypothetical protein